MSCVTVSIVLTVMVVAVLIAAATVAIVFHVDVRNGVGDRTYQPAGAADVHRHYRLGVGELRLDLARDTVPGRRDTDRRPSRDRVAGRYRSRRCRPSSNGDGQVGDVHVLGLADDGRNADLRWPGTAGAFSCSTPRSASAPSTSRAPLHHERRVAIRTFVRSSDDRVVAGVCAGIAQTLGVDPTLIRLVFAILAFAGGAGVSSTSRCGPRATRAALGRGRSRPVRDLGRAPRSRAQRSCRDRDRARRRRPRR